MRGVTDDPARGASVRPLVVGLGHPARHDDALGLEIVERVHPRLGESGEARSCVSDGTELLDLWEGRELVVVVDAVRSGAAPGTVHRLEVTDLPVPPVFRITSTHNLSIADVVALARSLDRLPARLVIYGVEGERFDPGVGLSDRVAAAMATVVDQVLTEVRGPAPRDGDRGSGENGHA